MDVPKSVVIAAAQHRYTTANEARAAIKSLAANVKSQVGDAKAADALNSGEDQGESIANLMLCYRHLEDASMRLGKVLQSIAVVASVYDRATTVGA